MSRPRPRLVVANAAPPAPAPTPLISSEARRKEQEGERFYPRVHLDPKDLPSMYRTLSAFPRRVERRTWRTPASMFIGAVAGLGTLGVTGNWIIAGIAALFVGAGAWISDGWLQ